MIKTEALKGKRRQEVLELIVSGKSNKVIAARLGVTENTVKSHVQTIFKTYKVESRAHLIVLFFESKTNTLV